MKTNRFTTIGVSILAGGLLFVWAISPSGGVPKAVGLEQITPQSAASSLQADSPKSSGEGIAVHGNWTIVVRDANGTVVDRRDFHNDLTACGATLLMAATDSQGELFRFDNWLIRLATVQGPHQTPVFLVLEELVIDVTPWPSMSPAITLHGTAAAVAGAFVQVETAVSLQGPSSICDVTERVGTSSGIYWIFTRREISTLVLQDGQSVEVTVEVSFN
jgi:hypothetical protein